ncbi:MAG: hypothetical protein ACPGUE_11995 [Marinomonas sp.]
MSKIVIGIDPDAKAHGVSVYYGERLDSLNSMTLMEIYNFIDLDLLTLVTETGWDIEAHIEDVCAMNAVFKQRQTKNNAVNMKMSNSVGKCQQSQIELERLFEYYGIKVAKHKISKMWKKDKAQFEKITGWTGRSNEDTRSAAYFGYLGTKA